MRWSSTATNTHHDDHNAPALALTMSEEGYPASTWDHTDSEHPSSAHNHAYNSMPPYVSRESLDVPGAPLSPTKSASPPRSSVDSPIKTRDVRWRESANAPSSTVVPPSEDGLVDASFDENVLRALCDIDVSTGRCSLQRSLDVQMCAVRGPAPSRPNQAEHNLLQGTSWFRPCVQHDVLTSR